MARNTAKNAFITMSLPKDSPAYQWLLRLSQEANTSIGKVASLEIVKAYHRQAAGLPDLPVKQTVDMEEQKPQGNASAAAEAWGTLE